VVEAGDGGLLPAHGESLRRFAKLARLVAFTEGALIEGPPGVGKTVLSRYITREVQRTTGESILDTAVTHVATALTPNGKTLSRAFKSHRRSTPPWVKVDEASMITLSSWAELCKWHLAGTKFVVIGDFEGQFKPITDRYSHLTGGRAIPDSGMMRHLTEGLRIRLEICKRAEEKEFFDRYVGLYPHIDMPPAQFVESMRRLYPAKFQDFRETDQCVVISHETRRRTNALFNAHFAAAHPEAVFVPDYRRGATCGRERNTPQPAWVWPGLRLLGHTRKARRGRPTHGVLYEVTEVSGSARTLTIRRSGEFAHVEETLTLPFAVASTFLRLAFASTYQSMQGRTVRNTRLLLVDCNHPSYSLRHLVVGMSRLNRGEFLHILTPAEEEELKTKGLARLREMEDFSNGLMDIEAQASRIEEESSEEEEETPDDV